MYDKVICSTQRPALVLHGIPGAMAKHQSAAGYGIFFEHGTGNESNTGSLEASAPVVLSMTQQLPVSYPCIGNVGYGPAFDPTNSACASLAGGTPPAAASVFPIDVTSIPTSVTWPYAQQWSFGVQRELPRSRCLICLCWKPRNTSDGRASTESIGAATRKSENPFGPNEPLTITIALFLPTANQARPATYPGMELIPFSSWMAPK